MIYNNNYKWQTKTWDGPKDKTSREIRREKERNLIKFKEKLSGYCRLVYERVITDEQYKIYTCWLMNSRFFNGTANDYVKVYINENREELKPILRICKIEMI